ncbi:MAG: DUF928 domain-containing protein, partial [Cyanobacteria bacterium J06639_1]
MLAFSLAIAPHAVLAQTASPAAAPALSNSGRSSSAAKTSSRHLDIKYVPPPDPPDRGTPEGRKGGGASRGECPAYHALAALVPNHQGHIWGRSASARPTFWFYIPAVSRGDLTVEFVLQDADDAFAHYATSALPPGPARVLNIPMPETAAPL